MRAHQPPSFHFPILLLILVFYAVNAGLTALAEQPYADEAWFASPAVNLVEHGYMGNSVKEIEGSPWTRMDKHTYWQPPLYFLAQAAWYKLFGIGLFQMRFLSVFFGLFMLLVLYRFLELTTRNRLIALFGVLILSVDFIFIDSASEGRMDMMASALGMTGLTAYLSLRERNLPLAMFVGHFFVVCGGLTHPVGIVGLLGIVFLGLYFDRHRLKFRHYLIAAIPYLAGGIGWGLYIMQDPGAFLDQFRQNMAIKFVGSANIFGMILKEFIRRYFYAYGPYTSGPFFSKLKLLIPFYYFAGFIGSAFFLRNRSRRAGQVLVWLTLVYFTVMIFIAINKMPKYMIWILPLQASLLSICVLSLASVSPRARIASFLLLGILLATQVGIDVRRISKFKYENLYMPAIEQLNYWGGDSALIMGTAEIAFAFDFSPRVIEDPSLGYYSGRTPDIVVNDARFKNWMGLFRRFDPQIYDHVSTLLDTRFEKKFENIKFSIYVRKDIRPSGNKEPGG